MGPRACTQLDVEYMRLKETRDALFAVSDFVLFGRERIREVATSSWSITMLGDKHFNRNEHWKGGFRFRLGG